MVENLSAPCAWLRGRAICDFLSTHGVNGKTHRGVEKRLDQALYGSFSA